VVLLPFSDGSDTLAGFVAAYVLVLLHAGALLYGFLVLAVDSSVPKLSLLGIAAGTVGVAATYVGGRPEALVKGSVPWPLALLFFTDALRMCAAACLGLTLARRVTSPGIALLIAGLATAADLFSAFVGPTKALRRLQRTLRWRLKRVRGLRPLRRCRGRLGWRGSQRGGGSFGQALRAEYRRSRHVQLCGFDALHLEDDRHRFRRALGA